ncbi:zinc-binding alcohol dehydrogenase family protein [Pseudonocardia sp. DSM 110487]|uniref:quinone oxidoreductase family protein n=1 Tax=Pseudonocardia sp. DSM 110487 TaxID=2865833 RepID=UPI001C6A61FA|nr:zinc-binding alcohol dehydrogenase family protein [Pseudonocardia sp. DSM 110487]QYN32387.1 zinc-binding alcohol dehydrogenase family protein [Pseudonocardia sp. DSM 110487]
MRAAQVVDCGRPPVVSDREPPAATEGYVLVDVLAAPITPLDLLCATGTSYFGRPATPYVPGVQGVGRAGARVVWFPTSAGMAPGDGSMAERAAVPEADLVTLPASVDPVEVAALGLSAVAAHMALTWRGELAPGEQVIVLGAGGVVGQAAVQLARATGARRVIAGARSEAARARAEKAGADVVVALDTDDVGELAERFIAAADGPVDLVLDPLYGAPAAAAAKALGPHGRLVNLGSSASETCPIDSSTLRGRSLRLLGYTNNALTREQRAAAVTAIAEHAAGGTLTVAHEVAPLADVGAAWQRQAEGTAAGRIVLRP